MKIVRKSNAQATHSNITDDAHGPPVATSTRSGTRREQHDHQSSGFKRADFSQMSRQELHDLINCQQNNGQLSSEDSATFTWLSTEVPIEGEIDGIDIDSHESIDFLDFAQRGMQTAHASGRQSVARQFERALGLMQAIQGQTIGVDTLA